MISVLRICVLCLDMACVDKGVEAEASRVTTDGSYLLPMDYA